MKKIFFLIIILFLHGCSEETKSVSWWKENIEEAKIKLEECKKTGSDSDNCKNVKEAVFRYKQSNATIPTFN